MNLNNLIILRALNLKLEKLKFVNCKSAFSKVLLFACCSFLISISLNAQDQKAAHPNVVFILVDDLGYHDLGITGSEYYETPHVDQLGRSSYRFTQGYAASRVCSPSRASIMTGVTPAVHGITDWIGAPEGEKWRSYGRHTQLLPPEYPHDLSTELLTIPEALKTQGYETFFAGKWHLGSEGSYPEDHGFDINVGGWESGSPKGGYFAPYVNPNLEQGPNGENLSLRLAKETVNYIEGAHDKPFFAMLCFYAVHGPIQTTEEKWQKYRNKAQAKGLADHGYEMERRLPIRTIQDNPVYGGLVETMDEAVGLVMDALQEQGLADNTIVIFTSDHGGVASGDNFSTSNLPLRGGKGYQWEGGLRVPYFIKVPGGAQGDIDYPVSGIDFLPTIMDMVGAEKEIKSPIEGKSLVAVMEGKGEKDRALYWHYPHYGNQGGDPSSIIRDGKWKLIHYYENDKKEVYNLEVDPEEKVDLSTKEPKVTAQLMKKLNKYLEKNNVRYPYADLEYDAKEEEKVLNRAKTVQLEKLENDRVKMLTPGWQPNPDWWGSKVTKD
ncbi:sulfatase [Echinicola sp. CAU 1574]|uniref:Sulfatase n=1 Tax=Echinicola arenosa TaxID=2774144 RepID=A0ABR9ARH8_9BACT|nr:sulfatase [Echinicola arenosa]